MQDRVSLYPGRVKLTPVAGEADTFDMARADQPTQEGTPLNKSNLFADDTSAMFGLDNGVPNDALKLLSRFNRGLGKEYLWGKYSSEVNAGSATDTGSSSTVNNVLPAGEYADTIDDLLRGNGTKFEITVWNTNQGPALQAMLSGKYFKLTGYNAVGPFAVCCYLPIDATVTCGVGNYSHFTFSKVVAYNSAEIVYTLVDYLNAPDENAYPPASADGYTYQLFGQLGNFALQIFSYVGTGVYGAGSPTTVTFSHKPRVVIIFGDGFLLILTNQSKNPVPSMSFYDAGSRTVWSEVNCTWNQNSLVFYSIDGVKYQGNIKNGVYQVIGLG